MKRPRPTVNNGIASVYCGSVPRTMTFSTLRLPLVMRLLSPKKNPRVPNVVTICASRAACRMKPAYSYSKYRRVPLLVGQRDGPDPGGDRETKYVREPRDSPL